MINATSYQGLWRSAMQQHHLASCVTFMRFLLWWSRYFTWRTFYDISSDQRPWLLKQSQHSPSAAERGNMQNYLFEKWIFHLLFPPVSNITSRMNQLRKRIHSVLPGMTRTFGARVSWTLFYCARVQRVKVDISGTPAAHGGVFISHSSLMVTRGGGRSSGHWFCSACNRRAAANRRLLTLEVRRVLVCLIVVYCAVGELIPLCTKHKCMDIVWR